MMADRSVSRRRVLAVPGRGPPGGLLFRVRPDVIVMGLPRGRGFGPVELMRVGHRALEPRFDVFLVSARLGNAGGRGRMGDVGRIAAAGFMVNSHDGLWFRGSGPIATEAIQAAAEKGGRELCRGGRAYREAGPSPQRWRARVVIVRR